MKPLEQILKDLRISRISNTIDLQWEGFELLDSNNIIYMFKQYDDYLIIYKQLNSNAFEFHHFYKEVKE